MSNNQIRWQRARVVSVERAADSIAEITLAADTAHRVEPGAHIDVRLPSGDTRSYSLAAGGPDGRLTLGVHRSPTSRGGSEYMHSLRPGDELEITEPLQNFLLRVGAPRYVLLAGGIGITAVRAMGAVLRRLGADYRFVYVGRSRSAMAFLPELEALHGDRLDVHIDDEGTGLDVAALVDGVDHGTELYMCGPIRLMDAVRRRWHDRDLPMPNLRYETFGNSGWFDAEEFTVTVPELDVTTTVGSDESMLDALRRAGVDMMFDCRKGECGLCEVSVASLDGCVDHRDVFFSEEQKRSSRRMCACVSRVVRDSASSRSTTGVVTLDLP
ncbi:vanillate demethylase subunit B [Rhodococcus rhodochrous J3]|uniref:Vanillate demethylase subunit B n=1 Tax=Rhodococcus rhodochrous J3 TaxID=903528 RepID=A0ABY1MEN2_RHORH|nr:PDR/VanB family oxidoreductase [Rhodococcus rhodochrous]MBF4480186.1 oxidoreductase [Rhodococcus rhodochrous]MCD2097440.1 PDR/VanB family oxidoreductase [Rhodococcus rhodochrous]MCD2122644.1 PDR/VanB family oxidoreductase [Rhodococcus rhodochrous]MCQ4133552.1 PDR/VanB family oxidoreductase [Rhodococcus rhodochrous]MDJ0018056.1 PDR/VanB family oxidoreductase [Rhodococcus rhodochrous]